MSNGSAPGWWPEKDGALWWWDGHQWTARAELRNNQWEVEPVRLAHKPSGSRRSPWILVLVVAVLVPVVLLIVMSVVNDIEGSSATKKMVAELDDWRLPPTVTRASRPDEIDKGELGATTPSVYRYFRPRGTTSVQAAKDLVAALREQGYKDMTFEEGRYPSGYGTCHASSRCDVLITPNVEGNLIEAYLSTN